ncbi:MAG: THUMP domain-containing protein [Bacteroidales bacterium]
MNREKFEMVAKTFAELEDVLAEELINIGADEVEIGRRMVSFKGDLEMMYKANLNLRTAVRILKPIAKFKAKSTDEVYEQIKKIRWEEIISEDQTFSIDTTVFSDEFSHSKFLTYRIKDGIVDYFMEKFDRRPSVRMMNTDIMINFHVAQEQCTISLDSSGESLHKRGWRVDQTEAPLNEVLAAGMVLKTGWRGESNLLDPMCGSGTILIEAAMIALNIPPGIFRKNFAFEKWPNFDQELFDKLYNDDSQEKDFLFKITGSDMSPQALAIAEQNIKNAGVGKYIELVQKDFRDYNEAPENTIVIMNPPYGERISTRDLLGLYQMIGERLKHVFVGCKSWVLSYRYECFEQIGLRPSAKLKLNNGGLECEFRRYEIFEGKQKDFKRQVADGEIENPFAKKEGEVMTVRKRPEGEASDFDRSEARGGFAGSDRGERQSERRSFFDAKGGDRKPFGDRGDRKPFGDRGDRKPFGDRGDRKPFGDRGDRKPFGDRGDRKPFGDRGDRKPFGDRGDRKPFGDRGDRKPFGDRGDRKPFGDRGDRKPFGDRGDRKPFGDRGDRKPFGDRGDRKPFGDRGDRKPFGDRGDRKPFGDRGDRKPFGDRGDRKPFGDRGDRKPFGDRGDRKPFGDRGDRKPFGDRGDRKPFGDRGDRRRDN